MLGGTTVLQIVRIYTECTIWFLFQLVEESEANGKGRIEEGVVNIFPLAQHIFGLDILLMIPSVQLHPKLDCQ